MSKLDDVLRDAINGMGRRDEVTRLSLEVVRLRSSAFSLRTEVTQLKAERRRWFRLLAAVLRTHGPLRVRRDLDEQLRTPTISVTDDVLMDEHVLELKTW